MCISNLVIHHICIIRYNTHCSFLFQATGFRYVGMFGFPQAGGLECHLGFLPKISCCKSYLDQKETSFLHVSMERYERLRFLMLRCFRMLCYFWFTYFWAVYLWVWVYFLVSWLETFEVRPNSQELDKLWSKIGELKPIALTSQETQKSAEPFLQMKFWNKPLLIFDPMGHLIFVTCSMSPYLGPCLGWLSSEGAFYDELSFTNGNLLPILVSNLDIILPCQKRVWGDTSWQPRLRVRNSLFWVSLLYLWHKTTWNSTLLQVLYAVEYLYKKDGIGKENIGIPNQNVSEKQLWHVVSYVPTERFTKRPGESRDRR